MKYRLGQEVVLEIIEALPEGRFIVSLDGHLIRTKPILIHTPKPKETIRARVVTVNPIGFQALPKKAIGFNRDI